MKFPSSDPLDTPAMRVFIKRVDRITDEMCREIRKRGPAPYSGHEGCLATPHVSEMFDDDPCDPWL